MINKINNARAKLIALLNGIEVKKDYPNMGCLSLSQKLGFQKSRGLNAKISPDYMDPYFEKKKDGDIIRYDLKITNSVHGSPGRSYFFKQGEDTGLVEIFNTYLGSSYEFFSEGIERFEIGDYDDFKPLIKVAELILGRELINKKYLKK